MHRPGENEKFASPNRRAIPLTERFTAGMFVPFISPRREPGGSLTLLFSMFLKGLARLRTLGNAIATLWLLIGDTATTGHTDSNRNKGADK